jgi:hypothetical protein
VKKPAPFVPDEVKPDVPVEEGEEVVALEDAEEVVVAAAGAPRSGNDGGAPASQPASTKENDASATSTTTSASLVVSGNNPATWTPGTAWSDNLGALSIHDGIAETIYSTNTVDVSVSGTTTLDYWAQIPGAEWLHATRDVVIEGAANDNHATTSLPAANDTGTDATTSAQ